jgi:hypothetical protein
VKPAAEPKSLQPWKDRFRGRTVIVLASGPSLTPDDVATVRASGHPVIVTNTTFRLAPWADVLVGYDVKWWRLHHEEIVRDFKGDTATCARGARHWARHCFADVPWLFSLRNTGAVSVALPVYAGASRVLMLGFDCQRTGGKTHWHGDHPATLGNAISIKDWPRCFKAAASYAKGKAEVLNCSRETALTCFPRVPLEEALR